MSVRDWRLTYRRKGAIDPPATRSLLGNKSVRARHHASAEKNCAGEIQLARALSSSKHRKLRCRLMHARGWHITYTTAKTLDCHKKMEKSARAIARPRAFIVQTGQERHRMLAPLLRIKITLPFCKHSPSTEQSRAGESSASRRASRTHTQNVEPRGRRRPMAPPRHLVFY